MPDPWDRQLGKFPTNAHGAWDGGGGGVALLELTDALLQ